MKVLRKREIEVKNVRIGDQIIVQLENFGKFTATAQKVTDTGAVFMFDDYIACRPMNVKPTNKGGFEKSDLKKWLDNELLPVFPKQMQEKIENITIPTYEQMFGHDDFYYKYVESDNDEQFPLMAHLKNRVAYLNNQLAWGWLQNTTKESAARFALVSDNGRALSSSASYSYGVRVVFTLNN